MKFLVLLLLVTGCASNYFVSRDLGVTCIKNKGQVREPGVTHICLPIDGNQTTDLKYYTTRDRERRKMKPMPATP